MKTKYKTIKKTVLITGAGRGLGRATAEAYHQAGFFVIATDINLELLSDLSEKKNYLPIKLDVSSEPSMQHCIEKLSQEVNQIDILISNAGIFDFYAVSEAGSDKLKEILDINVLGLANLTKYFLPFLLKAKGRLVVIGSESYKVPSPFQPYSVSKQALESVYKAIKIELSLKGIKSVLIRPGAMQTKIIDDTVQFKQPDNNSVFKKEFNGFLVTVPKYIGKIVPPNTVAKLVLKAGTVNNPKPVYHVNHNPIVSILAYMPDRIKNVLISRNLKK